MTKLSFFPFSTLPERSAADFRQELHHQNRRSGDLEAAHGLRHICRPQVQVDEDASKTSRCRKSLAVGSSAVKLENWVNTFVVVESGIEKTLTFVAEKTGF